MKAIQKYGPKYELIAEEIKTRSKSQVISHLVWLLKQVKADKSHPDRATLLAFDKKRVHSTIWTPKETSVLIKAVQKYGKDYQMISNAVKTWDEEQCQTKVLHMIRRITSDPKHENAKHAKLLNKIPVRVQHRWTDKEKKRFSEAIQKHGCSYKEIIKCLPTMTKRQIYQHAKILRNAV